MRRLTTGLVLAVLLALSGCAIGPDGGIHLGNACCVVQTGGGQNGPVNSIDSAPPGFFAQPNGRG